MSQRVQRFCDDFQRYCKEYSDRSQIHGVKYVAETRSLFEKVLWTFISVACVWLCLITISYIYVKYDATPVVLTYHSKYTPIYEMPYPVVTICPESKMKPYMFSYSNTSFKMKHNESVSEEDMLKYQYLYSICDQSPPYKDYGMPLYDENFFKMINQLKRDVPELMLYCQYMGSTQNCTEIFHPVLLKEGVCYSFNNLDKKHIFRSDVYYCCDFFKTIITQNDWDPQIGYGTDAGINAYPRRALVAGADNALLLHLRLDQMRKAGLVCKSSKKGFRIFLYNPSELPSSEVSHIRAALGQVVNIAILPDDKRLRPAARNVHWSKRGCYTKDERYLKYFKSYTPNNCMLECLTNYTLLECRCVAFYMPRTKKTPVCGSGSYHCVRTCQARLLRLDLGSKLASNKSYSRSYCNCLPRCSYLTYAYEVSSAGWHFREYMERHEHYYPERPRITNNDSMTQVRIFFKSNLALRIYRSEMYGWYEVIAKIGGIFQLLLGITLISALEMCYFFTLRIGANRRLYNRWAGPEHNSEDDETQLTEIYVSKN